MIYAIYDIGETFSGQATHTKILLVHLIIFFSPEKEKKTSDDKKKDKNKKKETGEWGWLTRACLKG